MRQARLANAEARKRKREIHRQRKEDKRERERERERDRERESARQEMAAWRRLLSCAASSAALLRSLAVAQGQLGAECLSDRDCEHEKCVAGNCRGRGLARDACRNAADCNAWACSAPSGVEGCCLTRAEVLPINTTCSWDADCQKSCRDRWTGVGYDVACDQAYCYDTHDDYWFHVERHCGFRWRGTKDPIPLRRR